ncbi:unnamed protein product [Penicillium bialowiezense]
MPNLISTISPSTNQVIFRRDGFTIPQLQKVGQAATKAFHNFRSMPFVERRRIVMKALELIQERKGQLGEELTIQMGRPIAYGTKEIETLQKRADYLLKIADDSLKPTAGCPEAGFQRWIEKDPIGPTLIIFAWNFPYLIIANSLIPALLAGNSVILKPSPQTPLVAERLAEIFHEAGLPENVLQVVHSGDPDTLRALSQLEDVRQVVFTGSTQGGRMLRESTANRFLPLSLELGGNDPAYVRQDANLRYVAEQLVDGAVFNAGQSCCAIERIYVHAEIHDAFVEELQKELAQYKLGDPFDKTVNIGPVVSRTAQQSINAQIEDAVAKGAVNATPVNSSFVNPPIEGNYVVPTILTNTNHSMAVMKEETFGPVIPVMKVGSDEEAVRWMNDSDYGLTASIWTNNLEDGKTLLKQLEAGTVFINRCDYPNPDLAWTGWKNSGMGHSLGPRAFDSFLKLKSYHIREQQG